MKPCRYCHKIPCNCEPDLKNDLEVAEQTAETLHELMFCPPHKQLFESDQLEPFGNCVACIRVQRNELLEQLVLAKDALLVIADWPFDIQGDCVASARAIARRVSDKLAQVWTGPENIPASIDQSPLEANDESGRSRGALK